MGGTHAAFLLLEIIFECIRRTFIASSSFLVAGARRVILNFAKERAARAQLADGDIATYAHIDDVLLTGDPRVTDVPRVRDILRGELENLGFALQIPMNCVYREKQQHLRSTTTVTQMKY